MLNIVNTFPLPAPAITAIASVPGVEITTVREPKTAAADLLAVDAFFGELPADGLERAPRLRWIARAGAGVEDLDLTALSARGITITNASGLHASSMGEYCLGALLFFSQRQAARLELQRRAAWDEEIAFAEPLRGRSLAILGYGSIGREVARLAAAFGMRVVAMKNQPEQRRDDGFVLPGLGDPEGRIPERIVGPGALHEVLAAADAVVIALPLTEVTRRLIDRAALKVMKPTAWIVNVGRGPMIDEAALVEALRAGRLGGAYLDVFDEEPLPADHAYWSTQNLFVSPHIAGVNSYERYWQNLGVLLEENVHRFAEGRPLLNAINSDRGY